MKNLIYFFPHGEHYFNGKEHTINFIKYLFSCSRKHQTNKDTKNNFYVKKDLISDKLTTGGFLGDNKKQCSEFLKYIKTNKIINNLEDDLFHAGFIIATDSFFTSNVFTLDNKTIEYIIEEEMVNSIVKVFYDNDEGTFEEAIGNFVDIATNKNLVFKDFKNLNITERAEVEKLIHKKLKKEYENTEVLFQISHNDQIDHATYHIHRLIKN